MKKFAIILTAICGVFSPFVWANSNCLDNQHWDTSLHTCVSPNTNTSSAVLASEAGMKTDIQNIPKLDATNTSSATDSRNTGGANSSFSGSAINPNSPLSTGVGMGSPTSTGVGASTTGSINGGNASGSAGTAASIR